MENEINFSKLNRDLNKQQNTLMGLINKCIDSSLYSKFSYQNRTIPTLYFQVEHYSINNSSLYLKGDEYPTYHYSWERMIDLKNDGIISEEKIFDSDEDIRIKKHQTNYL